MLKKNLLDKMFHFFVYICNFTEDLHKFPQRRMSINNQILYELLQKPYL